MSWSGPALAFATASTTVTLTVSVKTQPPPAFVTDHKNSYSPSTKLETLVLSEFGVVIDTVGEPPGCIETVHCPDSVAFIPTAIKLALVGVKGSKLQIVWSVPALGCAGGRPSKAIVTCA